MVFGLKAWKIGRVGNTTEKALITEALDILVVVLNRVLIAIDIQQGSIACQLLLCLTLWLAPYLLQHTLKHHLCTINQHCKLYHVVYLWYLYTIVGTCLDAKHAVTCTVLSKQHPLHSICNSCLASTVCTVNLCNLWVKLHCTFCKYSLEALHFQGLKNNLHNRYILMFNVPFASISQAALAASISALE